MSALSILPETRLSGQVCFARVRPGSDELSSVSDPNAIAHAVENHLGGQVLVVADLSSTHLFGLTDYQQLVAGKAGGYVDLIGNTAFRSIMLKRVGAVFVGLRFAREQYRRDRLVGLAVPLSPSTQITIIAEYQYDHGSRVLNFVGWSIMRSDAQWVVDSYIAQVRARSQSLESPFLSCFEIGGPNFELRRGLMGWHGQDVCWFHQQYTSAGHGEVVVIDLRPSSSFS